MVGRRFGVAAKRVVALALFFVFLVWGGAEIYVAANLLAPGIATIVLTFAAYLPGWIFEPDLWLRVQAARDRRTARRGVAIAMANAVVFVGILPLFIGVA